MDLKHHGELTHVDFLICVVDWKSSVDALSKCLRQKAISKEIRNRYVGMKTANEKLILKGTSPDKYIIIYLTNIFV